MALPLSCFYHGWLQQIKITLLVLANAPTNFMFYKEKENFNCLDLYNKYMSNNACITSLDLE